MSTTQELRKPNFVKVKDLEKTRSGYNVYVKVISTEPKEVETRDGQKIKMVDALVGDQTGVSKAFFKGDNATHIEKGNVIAIRNGLKKFIKNFISLELDIFGRVTKESLDINVDQSYNISEQEHKLPERPPRGPRNFDGRRPNRGPNNRPRRNDDRQDRPPRRNDDRQDRPPRRNDDDRQERPPRRNNDDRQDRPPRRNDDDRQERPPRRNNDDRQDRPPRRNDDDRQERPPRRNNDDRQPRRNDDDRQDRPPRRNNEDRPQRRENNNRTYDRDFDRRRENNNDRPPRREQQRYEPRREEFRERAPIQWSKVDEISPGDDRLNLIVKVIAEELVQGRNKNMLRCTLGDDSGLVKAFLQDTPALRVGKSVALFDCEARVVKEHIEIQCRGRVEAARKEVERVNEKFNLSDKQWVPVNQ